MDSSVIIKEMTLQDVSTVIGLWINTPNLCIGDKVTYAEVITRYLKRNPNLSYIARDRYSDKIVGTLVGGTDGMYGTFRHAVVLDEYRGQGVMKRMFELAFSAFLEYGVDEHYLYVLDGNKLGISFFSRNGWSEVEGVKVFRKKL